MYCTNCGKEVNDNMSFCSTCGTRLQNTTQQATQREDEIQKLQSLISYFSPKSDRYNEYDDVCEKLQDLLKGKRNGLLVWGIILSAMGSFLLFKFIMAASDFYHMSQDDFSSVFSVLFLAFLPGNIMIVGHILSTIFYHKNLKKYKEHYTILTQELITFYSNYENCPIGTEFSNPTTLRILLQFIQSGRADSIKDALNLSVDNSRKRKEQEISERIEKGTGVKKSFYPGNYCKFF